MLIKCFIAARTLGFMLTLDLLLHRNVKYTYSTNKNKNKNGREGESCLVSTGEGKKTY